jgi:anti-anti-sigma factor
LFDMEGVEFIDSSGIGWLLSMNRRFQEEGGAMALHSVPPMVSNALKLLRLNEVLTIAEDAPAAERSLGLAK